jgi:hypothetical protein
VSSSLSSSLHHLFCHHFCRVFIVFVVVFVDIVVDFYRINLSKTKEQEKEKMNEIKTRGVAAPPCCCHHRPCCLPFVSYHWSLFVIIFCWPALLIVIAPLVLLVPFHCSCFVITVLLLWAWAGWCCVKVVVPI